MEFGVFLSLILVVALALFVPVLMATLGAIIGPRKPSEVKQSVYECGILPEVDARRRFSVKFYQVAVLFVVFDVEVAFLFPWAVLFKGSDGMGMLWQMFVFLGVLTAGLVYVIKRGALEWE
jgi:NADH-quinone oxidoreductase subunit A